MISCMSSAIVSVGEFNVVGLVTYCTVKLNNGSRVRLEVLSKYDDALIGATIESVNGRIVKEFPVEAQES